MIFQFLDGDARTRVGTCDRAQAAQSELRTGERPFQVALEIPYVNRFGIPIGSEHHVVIGRNGYCADVIIDGEFKLRFKRLTGNYGCQGKDTNDAATLRFALGKRDP